MTARTDTDRLRFMISIGAIFDGLVGVPSDRYDRALEVAREHGRQEPTVDDELDGLRRCIDEAMERDEQ